MTKPSILFVCLGNICRSPLAEAICRSKYGDYFHRIDSAGTADYHIGEAPDPRTIRVGFGRGIDLARHRGRQIAASDFSEYDFIFAMDEDNLNEILRLQAQHGRSGGSRAKVEAFIPGRAVPDPYFGGSSGFEAVYDIIEQGCDDLMERLVKGVVP